MQRYFFDVEDGGLETDTEGRMLMGADAVAEAAMKMLLESTRFEVITNNERELSVTVRNSEGDPVYRTSLMVRAGWIAGVRG